MRKIKPLLIALIGIVSVLLLSACVSGNGANSITGAGKIVVMGCDWGPAVTKVIVTVPEELDKEQILSPDMFTVKETKKSKLFPETTVRSVTDVYFSDASGNPVDASSNSGVNSITLELSYSNTEGSPFFYDQNSGFNKWAKEYSLEVKMQKGNALLLSDKTEVSLNVEPVSFKNEPDSETVLLPELDNANTDGVFTGSEGNTLTYASYAPSNASEDNRRPLVIWLHGAGEGGTDPRIDMYGTKTVALMGNEFQGIMNGAYILVPQTAEYWKRNESGVYFDNENPGDHSLYLHDLQELIEEFVSSNYVDPDKIIIGGGSNGGFMSLDLLIHYPDFYAASYLVCEIYEPEQISDEELDAIKDIPMWFVYSKDDQTVVPSLYEEPLIKRLEDMGCEEVHVTVFDNVHDPMGNNYLGHFSWIYFFNNECYEDGLSLWEWISYQSK